MIQFISMVSAVLYKISRRQKLRVLQTQDIAIGYSHLRCGALERLLELPSASGSTYIPFEMEIGYLDLITHLFRHRFALQAYPMVFWSFTSRILTLSFISTMNCQYPRVSKLLTLVSDAQPSCPLTLESVVQPLTGETFVNYGLEPSRINFSRVLCVWISSRRFDFHVCSLISSNTADTDDGTALPLISGFYHSFQGYGT